MSSLLLLGKSGSGKSSTGNSILGKRAFIVSTDIDLEHVSNLVSNMADVEAVKLKVIDGLNICQCGDTADFSSAEFALKLSGEGISAFLIVLKYGDTFGDDERKVVDTTRAIFGTDVFRAFGICVLTFGDNFYRDVNAGEDSFKSVEEWFQQQSGIMRELFQECNKRCVLFNNRATLEKDKKEQVHNFMKILKCLSRETGRKYTLENYKKAVSSRLDLRKRSSLRLLEHFEPLQDFQGQCAEADCLEKTIREPDKHFKHLPDDLRTKFKTSTQLASKAKEFQSQDTDNKRANARFHEMANEKNIIKANSEYNRYHSDQCTSSEVEISHVSDTLTLQNNLKPDYLVNESKRNSCKGIQVAGEFRETDAIIDEMKQKIGGKETELIVLYQTFLTSLDSMIDEEQVRDLRKAVQEKKDFLETRVDSHRNPKRQKLEEGSDNSCKNAQDKVKTYLSNDVTLLLVGSAGNGKSAAGNSILGRQVFKTTASTTSQTSDSTMECGTIGDVKVSVVDGPGVDTDKSPKENLQKSIETLEKALKLCHYRFSALLIVLKYGERFTKQEIDFIQTVRGILGKHVIRDYGVCIITHGDNFEADNEDEHLSFKEWCKQQEGPIKDLFEECNHRCVLFNNRTKAPNLNQLQLNQLLELIPREKSYSENEFAAAFEDLQKIKIKTNEPKILEETKIFTSEIKTKMDKISVTPDMNEQFTSYKELLKDVNAFEVELLDKYGDPDNIKQSHLEIKVLRLEINNKIKTCLAMKTKKENAKEVIKRVDVTSNTSWRHPLDESEDDEKDYVFVAKGSKSRKQSSSDDSDSFSKSRDTHMSGRSHSGFREAHDMYGNNPSLRISQIYERLQYYKSQIQSMKHNNLPRESWKSLRSDFELKEEEWNIETISWPTTDRVYLEQQMLVIKGLFSKYMPKSELVIWKLVKYVYHSITTG